MQCCSLGTGAPCPSPLPQQLQGWRRELQGVAADKVKYQEEAAASQAALNDTLTNQQEMAVQLQAAVSQVTGVGKACVGSCVCILKVD